MARRSTSRVARPRRVLARLTIGLVVLVALGLAFGIALVEIGAHRLAAATRITSPDGIESLETVRLGGVEQTILVRGEDRHAPVLLLLHGGPGLAGIPVARLFDDRLTERFVVVHWDQRGAGLSCSPDVPDESLELARYVDDTAELLEILRRRFGVAKVSVLGHSWGSVLGTLVAQSHPELVDTYVGMGQIVDMRRGETLSLRYALARARADGNEEAIAQLEGLGQPPYPDVASMLLQREWLGHYGGVFHRIDGMRTLVRAVLTSPEYGLADKLAFYGCVMHSVDEVWPEIDTLDFLRDVPRLDVPVVFLVGRYDYNTPFELVAEYFERLEAPRKRLVWFEHSGHWPNLEEPEAFQEAVIREVLGSDAPTG